MIGSVVEYLSTCEGTASFSTYQLMWFIWFMVRNLNNKICLPISVQVVAAMGGVWIFWGLSSKESRIER
jgi:hypothetical protein